MKKLVYYNKPKKRGGGGGGCKFYMACDQEISTIELHQIISLKQLGSQFKFSTTWTAVKGTFPELTEATRLIVSATTFTVS
jgi:hypothetical protein